VSAMLSCVLFFTQNVENSGSQHLHCETICLFDCI
jgi:hypothetical protein